MNPLSLVKNIVFEVTAKCNCDCLYYYNVWKSKSYPVTVTWNYKSCRCSQLANHPGMGSLNSGEPFLGPTSIRFSLSLVKASGVVIITNGASMENIDRCPALN
jgi:MoaA/NifB/PqqE/SkfB family radical SAM enzyme